MIWITVLSAFVGGLIYGSFFEWALHRFVLHRPFLFVRHPYLAHAVTHHGRFGSGEDYHLLRESDKHLVRMGWWAAPLLLLVNAPAGILAARAVGSWWVLPGFLAAMASYYAAYEYFHWCMHVPRRRWFQSTRLFRWLDRHHRIHHLAAGRNLNVVFPLADWILGTRLPRASAEPASPEFRRPEASARG